METKFSERIENVPRSFIRDILKVASSNDFISFAGGLPNPTYFPVAELNHSMNRVIKNNSSKAFQYSITKGLPELRQKIADFYSSQSLNISVDNILITTGSQQALDLLGKVFINPNDSIIIEEPSYLGAIQAFSMYQPNFKTVPLESDGMNIVQWQKTIITYQPKFTYLVSNFQNPSGTTYSLLKRKEIAKMAAEKNHLIIEDDPYGDIDFSSNKKPNIYKYAPNNTVLLGSFSKTIVPGFRLGWIIAPQDIITKIEIAKQAADLHTNIFAQYVILDYLNYYDRSTHIAKIIKVYKLQAEAMCEAIQHYLPRNFEFDEPNGGMFLWLKMPDSISSIRLFDEACKEKVAFVPGVPFYTNKTDCPTLRLNFSCCEPNKIIEGIQKIASAFKRL